MSTLSIDPEWKPRQTRSNFMSLVMSSLRPRVFMCNNPILLLARDTAKKSSPGLTQRPRILTPLVDAGHHLRMKSNAYFPEVELFSSDLTHMAMCPQSEATKNPFENSLMQVTPVISRSSSPVKVMKAFSMYYLMSVPSTMNISPSAVVAATLSSSIQI